MVPTLFSVSYAGLWGQHKLDIEDFINKASALGYSAVELMGKRPHLSVVDMDDEELGRIKHCADEAGVEISTIAAYTNFTGGKSAGEVPFNEMQISYVRDLARVGERLGARIIRIFTGYSTNPDAYSEDWKKCVAAIKECCTVAEQYGLVVGVQNHHDTGISTDAYVELLNDVDHPNCRAMYDPWAPALLGEDVQKNAEMLAPRMVQTTLADYIKLKRYAYVPGLVNYRQLTDMVRAVPLGDGFIDLAGFFKGLKKGGFDGYVAYEMCSPLRGGGRAENLDKTATISLKTIKSLI